MESVADAVRLFRNTREWISPVLTQSAFLERGVLTPEEFVKAGDNLVSSCPAWQWCEGEESKLKDYLPRKKQFLLTRGVPSYYRVNYIDSQVDLHEDGIKGDGDGEWDLATLRPIQPSNNPSVTLINSSITMPVEEYLDIDDDDDDLKLDDSVAIPSTNTIPGVSNNSNKNCRRYDISLTYDKYYQTPRLWLIGYHENGSLLTDEELFDDIIQDYARKTVTFDPHPHLMSNYHGSIHPCQHASVMKRIIEVMIASGHTPTVDNYLFIFLKFLQSVIPTIEYDFTVDVLISK